MIWNSFIICHQRYFWWDSSSKSISWNMFSLVIESCEIGLLLLWGKNISKIRTVMRLFHFLPSTIKKIPLYPLCLINEDAQKQQIKSRLKSIKQKWKKNFCKRILQNLPAAKDLINYLNSPKESVSVIISSITRVALEVS